MKKLMAVLVILFTSQLSFSQIKADPIVWDIKVAKKAERLFKITCRAFIHPEYSLLSQVQHPDSPATFVYHMLPKEARSIGFVEERGIRIPIQGKNCYADEATFEIMIRTNVDSVKVGFEIEHKLLHIGVIYQPKSRKFSRTLINTKQNDETSNVPFDDRLGLESRNGTKRGK